MEGTVLVSSLRVSRFARFIEYAVSGVAQGAFWAEWHLLLSVATSANQLPCPSKKILEHFLPAKRAIQLRPSVIRVEHQEYAACAHHMQQSTQRNSIHLSEWTSTASSEQ